ncbi:hypothetical protein BGZ83_006865 [Gryganskiella cystojenkinii]|nr:hypothetical protein BGZ83_006865 [Gryganskiella cystojenkinii]
MDLPEIRFLVGHYLAPNDLAVCARISKEWRSSFVPLLYETINLRYEPPTITSGRRSILPSASTLERNAKHIRNLKIELPCILLPDLVSLTKDLRSLVIDHQVVTRSRDEGAHVNWDASVQLLINNPNIQRLELRIPQSLGLFPGADASHHLGHMGPACESLELIFVTIDFPVLVSLLERCQHLTTLLLSHCSIRGMGTFASLPSPAAATTTCTSSWFPTIVSLTLDAVRVLELQEALLLASRCPQLETLVVRPYYHDPVATPCDLTVLTRCPKLSRLTILGLHLEDVELATLLMNCGGDDGLQLLHLSSGRIGPRAQEALVRHFKSLKSLSISNFKARAWVSGRILRSCPNLVSFSCPMLDVDDGFLTGDTGELLSSAAPISGTKALGIVTETATATTSSIKTSVIEGGEGDISLDQISHWSCTGLQSLEIQNLWWSVNRIRNKEALAQLSALKDLKTLSIGSFRRRTIERDATKRDGPDRWTWGTFDRSHMEEIPDLRWMTETWPKMQQFSVQKNK